jgi:flagellar biosynthesis/type III secretory pathway protein FliH/vacuolar-type H+-ATPase subunit H
MSSFQLEDFSANNLGSKGKAAPKASVGSQEPKVPTFEEFERPNQGQKTWVPREQLAVEPSLDYLFSPFDPGKVEERKFKEDFADLPKPENYKYVQMDTRDTGIVSTLAMANKKASEIVASAFEQGRRMEESMAKLAQGESEEVINKAKEEAEGIRQEIKSKAQEEATAIVNVAKGQEAEIESTKAETEKIKLEMEELKRQTEAALAGVLAREAALAPREEEINKLKQEIENQRKEILDKASKEAQEAKATALQQGMAEGRAKGREQGITEGKTEVFNKASGFFKILDRMNGLWQELWQQNAPFMVSLAVDAAEAILSKEIKNGKGLAAGAFAACVDYLQKCHTATFRVRPEDLSEIEEARNELRGKVEGLLNISFKADPSLGPGDIVMESDAGLLDATLKNRRERVMTVLRQALEDGLVAELPPENPLTAPSEIPLNPPSEKETVGSGLQSPEPPLIDGLTESSESKIESVAAVSSEPTNNPAQ